jgi:hypothetical protein
MFHQKRPKAPITSSADKAPSASLPDDEASKESVAKRIPRPDLAQMIEARTFENGQLRQELANLKRKQGASMYLMQEAKLAMESLQGALANFNSLIEKVQKEGEDGEL